jgi:hypothetical protein
LVKNRLQPVHVLDELSDVGRALLLVAFFASDAKIADTIASAHRLRNDVLYLERYILHIAIDAPASPLLKQILADFVAGELSLLVFNIFDLRILHQLHVEADQFH